MILKFDKPISLEDARNKFNDNVKFITSSEDYPNIGAIEFNVDSSNIFKRKAIDPKITKQSKKIENRYARRVIRLWNSTFRQIIDIVTNPKKQEEIKVDDEQKTLVYNLLADFKTQMSDTAEKPFMDAFKLGKIRGQVISGQEMDDDLTSEDEQIVQDELDANNNYLDGFEGDLKSDLNIIMGESYTSYDELKDKINSKLKDPKKTRALLYTAAIGGLAVAGMVHALKQAKVEEGHFKPKFGYWRIHPTEGKGGEVCPGCLENEGKLFSLDEFQKEFGHNDCLSNCRCDLEFNE